VGERLAVALVVEERVHLLAGDFFFVERAQHDQRGAGVLEHPDPVQLVAQWPGADDQRMRQPHPEIGGGEIHYVSISSGFACSSSSFARVIGTLMPASCS